MPYRFARHFLAGSAVLAAAFSLSVARAQDTPPTTTAPTATTKEAPLSPEEKVKAAIQDQLDKQNTAITKKDIAGAMRVYSPDYVSIISNGTKMNYAQVRASIQKTMDQAEGFELSDIVDNVTVKGNTATADISISQKIKVKDPTGISHSVNVQVQARSFWVKGKTGWLLKRARTIEGGADLDGKPLQVAKPG